MTRYRVLQTVVDNGWASASNRYCETLDYAKALARVGVDPAVENLPQGALMGTRIGKSVIRLIFKEDTSAPTLPIRQDIEIKTSA